MECMTHNIDAIYDNGVFRPIEPVILPEGTRVHLRVEEENGAERPVTEMAEGEMPTLLERFKDVVGTIDELPEDSSINLDHYLYGRPKR
jgi:predicted DNA-binding antitoxin AbrB/MazE fold protein